MSVVRRALIVSGVVNVALLSMTIVSAIRAAPGSAIAVDRSSTANVSSREKNPSRPAPTTALADPCRALAEEQKTLTALKEQLAASASARPDLKKKRESAPRNERDEKLLARLFPTLIDAASVQCGADVCRYRLSAKTLPELNDAHQKLLESPWHAAIFVSDIEWPDETELEHSSLNPLDGHHAVLHFLSMLLDDSRTTACLPFTMVHAHVDARGAFTVTAVDGGGPASLSCVQAAAQAHQSPLPDEVDVMPADAEAGPP